MTAWLKRIAMSPPLHFLLVGILLYRLVPQEPPVIRVSDASQIDDEVLIEEARRLGMLQDPVVSARLAQIGAFVADHKCDDEEEAADIARKLNLDREDLVIRRYLIQMMKLALAGESDRAIPTEVELEAHLHQHADRFRTPEELELVHVFVSARHGDELPARAEALRDELPALNDGDPRSVRGLGDPFARPNRLTASRDEIRLIFGPKFSEGLDPTQLRAWQGPIASAHGVHWVWVDRRVPAHLPEMAAVRSRLFHHYRRIRRQEHLEKRLAGLRTRYRIVTGADEG